MILDTQSVLDHLGAGSDQIVVDFANEAIAGAVAAIEVYTGPLLVVDLGAVAESAAPTDRLQVTPLDDPRPFLAAAGLDISAGTAAAPFSVIPIATLDAVTGPTAGVYEVETTWPAVEIPADCRLWRGHYHPDHVPAFVRSAVRSTMLRRWATDFGTVSPTYDQISRPATNTPFVVPVGALEMLGSLRWGGIV